MSVPVGDVEGQNEGNGIVVRKILAQLTWRRNLISSQALIIAQNQSFRLEAFNYTGRMVIRYSCCIEHTTLFHPRYGPRMRATAP